jgi:hypothetical protein
MSDGDLTSSPIRLTFEHFPTDSDGPVFESVDDLSYEFASVERRDAFAYDELPDESYFRIIKLNPGHYADDVECTIGSYSLDGDACPEYETLSYFWGKDRPAVGIRGNGRIVKITPTLEEALRRLRSPDHMRVLWIDQICINQKDLAERSAQVNMMRRIYASASRVLMWLGLDNDDQARHAMSLAEKVNMLVRSGIMEPDKLPSEEVWTSYDFGNFNDKSWASIRGLWGVPYFSRMWTIQEVRVSPEARVVWGNFEFDWRGVSSLVKSKLGRTLRCRVLVRDLEECGNPWTELIATTQEHQATEPHDKFFALLGLVDPKAGLSHFEADYSKPLFHVYRDFTRFIIEYEESTQILSLVGRPTLTEGSDWSTWAIPAEWPDYPTSLFKFLQSHAAGDTKAKMQSGHEANLLSLEGLVLGGVRASTESFGSINVWQEHFPRIEEAWSLAREFVKGFPEKDSTVEDFVWSLALGKSETNIREDDNSRYLLLDFAQFYLERLEEHLGDLIGMGYEGIWYLKDDCNGVCQRHHLEIARRVMAAYRSLSSSDRDGIPYTPEALADIHKQHRRSFRPENEPKREEQVEFWRGLRSKRMSFFHEGMEQEPIPFWRRHIRTLLDSFRGSIEERAVHLWMSVEPTETASDFGNELQRMKKRKFFVSTDGRMGCGPQTMEVGDVVCVLFGGPTPYILRPVAGTGEYLFVGECYVPGLMDGQALSLPHLQQHCFPIR